MIVVMKLFICTAVMIFFVPSSFAQSPLGSGNSPRDVVDHLWKQATEGELLSPNGWQSTTTFFVQHAPFPGKGEVRVVSNYWGLGHTSVNNDTAEVDVEYSDAGKINSSLQYSPPVKTPFYKTSLLFHLVFSSTQLTMFKSDGKTITGREDRPGPMEWQIKDSPGLPWTTVNTAVRYVLEMREKTDDPAIKKNADQTIAKLLQLH
jgi:hypothetical protein